MWRRLQPAGSRLVSTLVPAAIETPTRVSARHQECVRHQAACHCNLRTSVGACRDGLLAGCISSPLRLHPGAERTRLDIAARVAKPADAKDLKSFPRQRGCGFECRPGHHAGAGRNYWRSGGPTPSRSKVISSLLIPLGLPELTLSCSSPKLFASGPPSSRGALSPSLLALLNHFIHIGSWTYLE